MNKQQTIMTALALAFCVVVTTPVGAANCAGGTGTEVVGVDSHSYCVSKMSMNWWSAFAWCEAAGKTLISLEDCNGSTGAVTGDSQCPNFKGKGSSTVWTSSVPNASAAYYVNLSSGDVTNGSLRNTSDDALCK